MIVGLRSILQHGGQLRLILVGKPYTIPRWPPSSLRMGVGMESVLSWQATAWAIKQQETKEPNQRFVLLCLANYAGPDGCNAFPAVNTLAEDTGLSESTVRRKLQELEELELVNRGNQAIAAAHIERADRRPIVYDLPLERGVTVLPREPNGVSNNEERGVNQEATGCQAMTPDPPSDPPYNYKKRARVNPMDSRAADETRQRRIRDKIWDLRLSSVARDVNTIATLTGTTPQEVQRELDLKPPAGLPSSPAPAATAPAGSREPGSRRTSLGASK